MLISTPANAFETGQPSHARHVSVKNVCSSLPGTLPLSASCEIVMPFTRSECAGRPTSLSRFQQDTTGEQDVPAGTSDRRLLSNGCSSARVQRRDGDELAY